MVRLYAGLVVEGLRHTLTRGNMVFAKLLRTERVVTPPSPPLPRGWVLAENAAGQAAYLDVVRGRVGRWGTPGGDVGA